MKRSFHASVMLAFLSMLPALAAHAEPTDIVVRVLTKDAKFVGTSMGGMRIILRDALTGEILATGITEGGTGDTKRLMHTDGGRRAPLADESAAAFSATLDLDAPRLIEAEAYGPLARPESAHRVVSSQWVVPGRHLSAGDGWVIELPGLVVDILEPLSHSVLAAGHAGVRLTSEVAMMCGCPIEPDGLWDAGRLEVAAILGRDGREIARLPLAYAGQPSRFSTSLPALEPGVYDLLLYAYDRANGNTGVDRISLFVAEGAGHD